MFLYNVHDHFSAFLNRDTCTCIEITFNNIRGIMTICDGFYICIFKHHQCNIFFKSFKLTLTELY